MSYEQDFHQMQGTLQKQSQTHPSHCHWSVAALEHKQGLLVCRQANLEFVPLSLAVKCKSEENCAFDDNSTIFSTEIIEILRNIF